jgi:hypothetical protein
MEPALGETSRKRFFMLGCAFGAAGIRFISPQRNLAG